MEKSSRDTVMEYLRWRGDLPFSADPFNEVDNLILSILAYLNYRRFPELTAIGPAAAVPLRRLAREMDGRDEQQGLSQLEYLPLLRAAASTVRFGDVGVLGYVTEHDHAGETQFDAISFLLPDKTVFCAYMGTDMTLAGWKEDLNLSFMDAVPAQRKAVEYAERMAACCRRRGVRLGGHSKGGNLAVYAALHVSPRVRHRILAVYCNDGPGFAAMPDGSEAYRELSGRIHSFVPDASVVGGLLYHWEPYTVVDSYDHLLLQHEPMSWRVEGNRLARLEHHSPLGRLGRRLSKAWIDGLSQQRRQEFSAALFVLAENGGQNTTLQELFRGSAGRELVRRYLESDRERAVISAAFDELKALARQELHRLAEQELKEMRQGLGEVVQALRSRVTKKENSEK